jgi:hypothetical protein
MAFAVATNLFWVSLPKLVDGESQKHLTQKFSGCRSFHQLAQDSRFSRRTRKFSPMPLQI